MIDVPPRKPEVIEYHLHRLRCEKCGITTCADLPEGVPTGAYGPRLQGIVTLLTGSSRLSKRNTKQVLLDLLGVPISSGQICNIEQQIAQTLEPVVTSLMEYVQTQHAHIDETGLKENRKRGYLWVVATTLVTVFRITLSRAAWVAGELVNPYLNREVVIHSDRYSGYNWIDLPQRQLCWAHLMRDFRAMVDRQNEGSAIGKELLCSGKKLFAWWHRVRDGTLKRSSFQNYVRRLRNEVQKHLEAGMKCGCAKTAGTCKALLKVESAFWTFARVEGVEPTSNAAEQQLRHAVLWCKNSLGTASTRGSRYVERILSAVATCRQQERNVLDFLTQCCEAKLYRQPAPSLIPSIT